MGLPTNLRLRIREYLRESQHMQRVQSYFHLKQQMSVPLRGEIALRTHFDAVKSVSFFQECQREFIIEISLSLEGHLFAPREFFPQFGRMWLVARGAACREGNVYVPGTVFGEDMILDSFEL